MRSPHGETSGLLQTRNTLLVWAGPLEAQEGRLKSQAVVCTWRRSDRQDRPGPPLPGG